MAEAPWEAPRFNFLFLFLLAFLLTGLVNGKTHKNPASSVIGLLIFLKLKS